MKPLRMLIVFAFPLSLLAAGSVLGADDSKVKAATTQVAQYSGEKVKDAGEAAAPPAKSAWSSARDSATGVGHSVKTFFISFFSK